MSKFALAASATALLIGLPACGSSSSSSSAGKPAAHTPAPTSTGNSGSTTKSGGLTVAADPSGQLKFDKTSLTTKAGTVTITFTNSSSTPHNLTIQKGADGAVVAATPTFQGGTKALSVSLKAGTYTFFCSVPGHRQAGMVGTLTVR